MGTTRFCDLCGFIDDSKGEYTEPKLYSSGQKPVVLKTIEWDNCEFDIAIQIQQNSGDIVEFCEDCMNKMAEKAFGTEDDK